MGLGEIWRREGRTDPIDSSRTVARTLKEDGEWERTSIVCPPETRSVRKGNVGGVAEVRKGVRACACLETQEDSVQHRARGVQWTKWTIHVVHA